MYFQPARIVFCPLKLHFYINRINKSKKLLTYLIKLKQSVSIKGEAMRKTNLDKRFFESTRGRIVLLLRASEKTVNDLAAHLQLTDNAVRAHLLSLERDGLVTG